MGWTHKHERARQREEAERRSVAAEVAANKKRTQAAAARQERSNQIEQDVAFLRQNIEDRYQTLLLAWEQNHTDTITDYEAQYAQLTNEFSALRSQCTSQQNAALIQIENTFSYKKQYTQTCATIVKNIIQIYNSHTLEPLQAILNDIWLQVESIMMHQEYRDAYAMLNPPKSANLPKHKAYIFLYGYLKTLDLINDLPLTADESLEQFEQYFKSLMVATIIPNLSEFDTRVYRLLDTLEQRDKNRLLNAYNIPENNHTQPSSILQENVFLEQLLNKKLTIINKQQLDEVTKINSTFENWQAHITAQETESITEFQKQLSDYEITHQHEQQRLINWRTENLEPIAQQEQQAKENLENQYQEILNEIQEELQNNQAQIEEELNQALRESKHTFITHITNASIAVASSIAAYFTAGMTAVLGTWGAETASGSLLMTSLTATSRLVSNSDQIGAEFRTQFSIAAPSIESTPISHYQPTTISDANNSIQIDISNIFSRLDNLSETIRAEQAKLEQDLYFSFCRHMNHYQTTTQLNSFAHFQAITQHAHLSFQNPRATGIMPDIQIYFGTLQENGYRQLQFGYYSDTGTQWIKNLWASDNLISTLFGKHANTQTSQTVFLTMGTELTEQGRQDCLQALIIPFEQKNESETSSNSQLIPRTTKDIFKEIWNWRNTLNEEVVVDQYDDIRYQQGQFTTLAGAFWSSARSIAESFAHAEEFNDAFNSDRITGESLRLQQTLGESLQKTGQSLRKLNGTKIIRGLFYEASRINQLQRTGQFWDAGIAAGDLSLALAGSYGTARGLGTLAVTFNQHYRFQAPLIFNQEKLQAAMQRNFLGSNGGNALDTLDLRSPVVRRANWLSDFVPDGHVGAGSIKLSLLKERYQFLSDKGMLQDRIRSTIGMETNNKPRTVFRNRHLYDPSQVDLNKRYKNRYGKTNLELMSEGKPPVGIDGKILTILHHFDQKHQGAWIVLPNTFHQRYHKKLHSSQQPIHGVQRALFDKEREISWKLEYNNLSKELVSNITPKLR